MTAKEYILMNGGVWPEELPPGEQQAALRVQREIVQESTITAQYLEHRPWVSVCQACPHLSKMGLAGRCEFLFSLPQFRECACQGMILQIIPERLDRCPLGHHDHIEEMSA